MGFNGFTFAGASHSATVTPTNIGNVTSISISNAIYDNVYVQNSGTQLTSIPDNWDLSTELYAQFQGTLNAGNIDYMLNQINAVRIKRRIVGDTKWITLFEVPVETIDDLTFVLYDRYTVYGTSYEYAMIPVIDQVEGSIVSSSATSKFNGLYITDGDESYHTIAESNIDSYQKNHGGTAVETLGNRYPYFVQNGKTNYDSGNAQGLFLPVESDGCTIKTDGAFAYRQKFNEFLINGKAKMLKDCFGQAWLVQITDNPSISTDGHPYKKITAFSWVEIGDVNSQEDLFNNGFIDVAPHITEG